MVGTQERDGAGVILLRWGWDCIFVGVKIHSQMSKKKKDLGNSLTWRASQCQVDSHISHNKHTRQDRRSLYSTRLHYTAALMINIYCLWTHFLSNLLNVRWQGAGWMKEESCKKKSLNRDHSNMKHHHLQRNVQSLFFFFSNIWPSRRVFTSWKGLKLWRSQKEVNEITHSH